nr:PadR family transcriptional regulator [uncultured Caproiciproducens sp.]
MRDNINGGALTETTFFILLSVYKPSHGYGIMQFISSETGGRLVLGAGTLYGAIHTLLKKGWIIPCGDETNDRKKEYIISDAGRQVAESELKRLNQVYQTGIRITRGGNTT